MPPVPRPFPRFIADSPQEGRPYGRWEDRLAEEFAKACRGHSSEAGSLLDRETLKWFPERGWAGRIYVPATGRGSDPVAREGEVGESDEAGEAAPVEYFGWVSFERPGEGEPGQLRASADFTHVTAGAAQPRAPILRSRRRNGPSGVAPPSDPVNGRT